MSEQSIDYGKIYKPSAEVYVIKKDGSREAFRRLLMQSAKVLTEPLPNFPMMKTERSALL